MSAQIKVVIHKNGEVTTEVSGVTGSLCESITRALHEALGGEVEVNFKPEHFVEISGIEQKVFENDE